MSTPQFGRVRTRLPGRPQPVPPIVQPQVPADAIVWAAEHALCEVEVGRPTVRAVDPDRLAPGLRRRAWKAYDSRQADEPVGPDRTDNLFGPRPGDHGRSDRKARTSSALLSARMAAGSASSRPRGSRREAA